MKRFRELIYDISDVVMVFAIITIAALLILWRVNAIMEYPEHLAKNTHTTKISDEVEKSSSDTQLPSNIKNSNTDKSKDTSEKDHGSVYDAAGKTVSDSSANVKSGSAQEAAESLVSQGYFKSYDDFLTTCRNNGIDPNLIKGGSHSIPAGSTNVDIAIIVTQ